MAVGFACIITIVLGFLVWVIGEVVLVAPFRQHPRWCTVARFTTWFAAFGTVFVPVIGTAAGAALGFFVGHVVWAGMGADPE